MISCLRLTPTQRRVLLLLWEEADANRFVKMSLKTLARESGLSVGETSDVVLALQAKDAIAQVTSSKFWVKKVNLASIIVVKPEDNRADVQSPSQALPARESSISPNLRDRNPINTKYFPERGGAHARVDQGLGSRIRGIVTARRTMLSSIGSMSFQVAAPKQQRTGPWAIFETHKYRPETWGTRDVVCYYATLFRFEYGAPPGINWQMDGAAAKMLLNKLGGGEQAKRYLQLAFALFGKRYSISSLRSLTSTKMMTMINQRWDDQWVVDDYADIEVFA